MRIKMTIFLPLLLFFSGCEDGDSEQVDEAVRKGDAVVTAINSYRAIRGSYPEKLEKLIPQYLDSDEAISVSGESFYYAKAEDAEEHPYGFDLSFVLYPNGFFVLGAQEMIFLRYDPERIHADGPKGEVLKTKDDWVIRKEKR